MIALSSSVKSDNQFVATCMVKCEAPSSALGFDMMSYVNLVRYLRFVCVLETLRSIHVDLGPVGRRQPLRDA